MNELTLLGYPVVVVVEGQSVPLHGQVVSASARGFTDPDVAVVAVDKPTLFEGAKNARSAAIRGAIKP